MQDRFWRTADGEEANKGNEIPEIGVPALFTHLHNLGRVIQPSWPISPFFRRMLGIYLCLTVLKDKLVRLCKILLFYSFFFFGCAHGMWKFLGQGSNLYNNSDPSSCSDKGGSLTHFLIHVIFKQMMADIKSVLYLDFIDYI